MLKKVKLNWKGTAMTKQVEFGHSITIGEDNFASSIDVWCECNVAEAYTGNRKGHPDTWEPDEPPQLEDILTVRTNEPGETQMVLFDSKWKSDPLNINGMLIHDQAFIDKACGA